MPGINLEQAKGLILTAIKAKKSLMAWGPPGVGKSELFDQIAKEMGLELIDIRLSLLNPVDLRGLPVPMTEGDNKTATYTTWLPPHFLPRKGKGILLLDEINLAVPTVQSAAYQLVLNRKLGEYTLPEGWAIVAAGNRAQDRSNVFEMSFALKNRFIHVKIEPEIDCWKKWAVEHDVHPGVVAYLCYRPQNLLKMPDNPAQDAYPTPRSWVVLSDMIKAGMALEPDGIARAYVGGIIGDGHAVEYCNFHKMESKLPNITAIFEGKNPTFPKGEDSMSYLIITTLAYETRRLKTNEDLIKAATNSINYLGNQGLSKEFLALYLTSCMASNMDAKVRGEVFKKCRSYLEPLRQMLGM